MSEDYFMSQRRMSHLSTSRGQAPGRRYTGINWRNNAEQAAACWA